jgi:hypothetical protein
VARFFFNTNATRAAPDSRLALKQCAKLFFRPVDC